MVELCFDFVFALSASCEFYLFVNAWDATSFVPLFEIIFQSIYYEDLLCAFFPSTANKAFSTALNYKYTVHIMLLCTARYMACEKAHRSSTTTNVNYNLLCLLCCVVPHRTAKTISLSTRMEYFSKRRSRHKRRLRQPSDGLAYILRRRTMKNDFFFHCFLSVSVLLIHFYSAPCDNIFNHHCVYLDAR